MEAETLPGKPLSAVRDRLKVIASVEAETPANSATVQHRFRRLKVIASVEAETNEVF